MTRLNGQQFAAIRRIKEPFGLNDPLVRYVNKVRAVSCLNDIGQVDRLIGVPAT
ncbi:hypothetical protein O6012_17325 [Sphingomonas aerolata]